MLLIPTILTALPLLTSASSWAWARCSLLCTRPTCTSPRSTWPPQRPTSYSWRSSTASGACTWCYCQWWEEPRWNVKRGNKWWKSGCISKMIAIASKILALLLNSSQKEIFTFKKAIFCSSYFWHFLNCSPFRWSWWCAAISAARPWTSSWSAAPPRRCRGRRRRRRRRRCRRRRRNSSSRRWSHSNNKKSCCRKKRVFRFGKLMGALPCWSQKNKYYAYWKKKWSHYSKNEIVFISIVFLPLWTGEGKH